MTSTIDPKVQALLTAAEVARHYEVAAFSVHRWVGRGCPCVRQKPLLLDLEAVKQWRAEEEAEKDASADRWRRDTRGKRRDENS